MYNKGMLLIFIRTIIVFIITFLIIRLMGKRQIGEMQPFEFVITLLIAELASIPMTDLSIPLGYGIIAVLTMFILHQTLTVMEKNGFLSRVISSKPSVIIDSNGINFKELKRLNIGINELQENIRNAGYGNFDEIEYALLETNGKFSILKKQQDENRQKPPKTPLPVCIIEAGRYKEWELGRIGADKGFFESLLKRQGVKNTGDVEVATIDNNGKFYFQSKNGGYKVLNIEFEGGRKW